MRDDGFDGWIGHGRLGPAFEFFGVRAVRKIGWWLPSFSFPTTLIGPTALHFVAVVVAVVVVVVVAVVVVRPLDIIIIIISVAFDRLYRVIFYRVFFFPHGCCCWRGWIQCCGK